MYHIRSAILEDCPDIARTQVDSFRTAYAGLLPEPYLARFTYAEQAQDWVDLITSNPDDILLVALSDEKQVIGYVLAKAKPDIFPGYDAEIVALHIRQPFQRKGIGTALLKSAIERLIACDCKSAMLWTLKNNKTRGWYEKLNGKLLDEKNYEIDDWVVSEVAYGWKDASLLL